MEQTIKNIWNDQQVQNGLAVVGFTIIVYCSLKLIYGIIKAFRLYFLAQRFCPKTDYVKRYGRWAIISGATDGIGLAMARELAQMGHSIIVIGRNDQKLAATKESLEKERNVGEVVTVKIDLSDSSIENFNCMKEKLELESRDIGILINNAGYFPSDLKRVHQFSMSDLRSIVNLNILATVYLTKMVLPGMIDRGRGLILNVSSLFSLVPGPLLSVYAPTKVFMDAFSRQLEVEYYNHPIDIINLNPGAVHTKLFINLNSKFSKPSIFNPTAEVYAKSALNALSCRITPYCGTFAHEMAIYPALIPMPNWLRGFVAEIYFKRVINNFKLSPAMKRRAN